MGAGFFVDPTASDPWQDRVTGSITDTKSVAPPVAVSPPVERVDAYTRAIQGVTPGTLADAAKEIGRFAISPLNLQSVARENVGPAIFGVAPATRTYANSASFPDPQDHPERGPITNIGYSPASGNEPGRFTISSAPDISRTQEDRGAGARSVAPARQASGISYPQGSADSQVSRLRGNQTLARIGSADYVNPLPQNAAPIADSAIAGGAPNDERLARMRDELAMYAARDRADEQGRINAMQANANWATDWTAKRDAENAARSANFRATNGADMVLASGSREYEGQRAGILGAARDANANLKAANADLQKSQAGLTGPPRKYIDEAAEAMKSQALNTTARSRTTDAQARTMEAQNKGAVEQAQAEGIKLTNDQHRKVLDLAAQMGSAKTPDDAAKAERQIYAILGKNPDEYGIIHSAGGTAPDPNNPMMQIKIPDRVWYYSKRNPNDIRELTGSSGGAGAPKGMKQVGTSGGKPVYEDANGKRFIQP